MKKVEMMNEVRELLKKHDEEIIKETLILVEFKLGSRLANYVLDPPNRSKSLKQCVADILNEYKEEFIESILWETE